MTDPLTPEVLAELEALEQAATRGEWVANLTECGSGTPEEIIEAFRKSVLGTLGGVNRLLGVFVDDPERTIAYTGCGPTSDANAEFIAKLRNAAPVLLAAAGRWLETQTLLSDLAANLAIYAHAWRTDSRVPTFASDISEGLLAKAEALLRTPEEQG